MARRYLIVSDLHLCDIEDHADGWKAYKSKRFVFDADLAGLFADFSLNPPGSDDDERVLVLNGDIIDFDLIVAIPEPAPWPVSRRERRLGLDATASKSAWKLGWVLGQHPVFVDSLVRYLAHPHHRLVYVFGNHDRELQFPEVQAVFREALEERARALRCEFIPEAVRFEPWFYYVAGELYAEHGQQYDHYTAFRNILRPTLVAEGEEQLALPMGNLSNRFMLTRMGFFNPYATDYILNAFAYVWHWLKKYAFTRRSLVMVWLWSSLVVMGKLLRNQKLLFRARADLELDLSDVADRHGLPRDTVAALYGLQVPPITSRFFLVVREFWLDRLALSFAMIVGTIGLALASIPLWVKLMVPFSSFPLAFFLYERLFKGSSVFSIETILPKAARRVAALLPVPVITFGHTHKPRLWPLSKGVSFVDTGAWAPITERTSGGLAPGLRDYLLVTAIGGAVFAQLRSYLPAECASSDLEPIRFADALQEAPRADALGASRGGRHGGLGREAARP